MLEIKSLTVNEVSLLSDTPTKVVRKAIEERVVLAHKDTLALFGFGRRDLLDPYTVSVLAVLNRISIALPRSKKIAIAKHVRDRVVHGRMEPLHISEALVLDTNFVTAVIRDTLELTTDYLSARDKWIERDEEIKGGTPVIKGTRMSVFSVLGRIEGGEAFEDIANENPDIPLGAIKAAYFFAKANPMRGRPSGKPWEKPA